MSGQDEVQIETFQRSAPKTAKKNFGALQSKQNPKTNATSRLGKNPGRQYFDSAEYSLHKDAAKKEEPKESTPEQKDQQN